MTCTLYAIAKKDPQIAALLAHQQRQCQQFNATLEIVDLLPANLHNSTPQNAQALYTKTLSPYLKPNALCVAMHPTGKLCNSQEFSQILAKQPRVHFFIAGAYGFAPDFLNRCLALSLSPLTFSHQIAKLVLCEQIFRALSLLNHHPYHK
ncbi:23S rRNA (pseudouridine(1915)-N(3))-methyltransferase RlmH [Helicobacter bizzozeronii]|uniref:23S rRNA (pseudouridine(1915)-N(3))-methyltransferase RlmH n=1 Tax=Helicobacter bizzozeronii TaxID=56877 RepID=UPI000CF0A6AD|nr:23S rRNA (pseudouridine(1915)-N(3))-methyltransferase RlmH [Helicobacter bizzozeronii]